MFRIFFRISGLEGLCILYHPKEISNVCKLGALHRVRGLEKSTVLAISGEGGGLISQVHLFSGNSSTGSLKSNRITGLLQI